MAPKIKCWICRGRAKEKDVSCDACTNLLDAMDKRSIERLGGYISERQLDSISGHKSWNDDEVIRLMIELVSVFDETLLLEFLSTWMKERIESFKQDLKISPPRSPAAMEARRELKYAHRLSVAIRPAIQKIKKMHLRHMEMVKREDA